MTEERFQAILGRLESGQPPGANKEELELACRNLLIPAQTFFSMTDRGEKDVVWLDRDEALKIGQTLTMAQVVGIDKLTKEQHEQINAAIALLKPKRLRSKVADNNNVECARLP